jgi:Uma2 family endonuclease
MSSQPKTFLTPEEYLEIDRKADRKSEYWAGEMYAMAGAGRFHNLIAANVT